MMVAEAMTGAVMKGMSGASITVPMAMAMSRPATITPPPAVYGAPEPPAVLNFSFGIR